ncbi:response regulator [Aequorivita sp. F47161]|uniref:Response regulator n=1 Tax=Aequorivita vitellina TaxID=2874475 RepID=A0A9X1R046_9FLAO|nr:response regulator [Aequorivita vitellina]MCG2419744.1 response regulator [Aequorivita vitellina]
METKSINVFMVDDHAMILKSYADELKKFENHSGIYRFQIERAYSLLQAIDVLKFTFEKREMHLVLLDIGLPNCEVPGYKSGLELGIAIRENYPKTKIIVITSYNSYPLIQRLFDLIKPEGLLLKGELNPEGLRAAVQDVLEGVPHFTKTVRKFLTQAPVKPNILDHYDMLILYYLSEGVLTKDLVNHLPLSLRSIERRKNNLKDILKLDYKSSDVMLLNRAKEEGFL